MRSAQFFDPTTLDRALDALGFVQADPIRAPARAQDLTLRPRVIGYRAGDLERLYANLPIEEDVFINYGFVTRTLQALMHPRTGASLLPTARNKRAQSVLAFVRERGAVHPREVDAQFAHGTVTNYWGGSSNATTHLLDAMHYKGLLRVVRVKAVSALGARACPRAGRRRARRQHIDAIVDIVVRRRATTRREPGLCCTRLRYAVPQWRGELPSALQRAKQRLSHARSTA